jgi:hypothetical protein
MSLRASRDTSALGQSCRSSALQAPYEVNSLVPFAGVPELRLGGDDARQAGETPR